VELCCPCSFALYWGEKGEKRGREKEGLMEKKQFTYELQPNHP